MNNEDLISDLDALLAVTSTHEFRATAIDAAKFIYETQVEEFAIRLQNAISDSEDLDNSEIVANIALALRESMDDFFLITAFVSMTKHGCLWLLRSAVQFSNSPSGKKLTLWWTSACKTHRLKTSCSIWSSW